MEKRAVIEEGRTPPEKPEAEQQKQGAERDLAEHATKRLADAVTEKPTK